MLMMSRREGETILIGDDIEIVIAQIARSRVKVGIRAPRETLVIAREVKLVRDQNLAAAKVGSESGFCSLLKRFQACSSSFSGTVRKGSNRQEAGLKH
jgi:carbon storage regulator